MRETRSTQQGAMARKANKHDGFVLEARGGIEPPIKVLQTFALPLGDRASDLAILPDSELGITPSRAEFPFPSIPNHGLSEIFHTVSTKMAASSPRKSENRMLLYRRTI